MSILPNHWFYNTESGELTNGNNLENLGNNLVGGLGWHELNIPGSATKAQAVAAAKAEFPKGKAPTTSVAKGIENTTPAADITSDAAAVTTFLGDLSFSGTWVRVAKVAIGSVLVIVGLMRMTGTDEAAAAAVKGAVL
jgi:hypothetical protein